MFMTQILFHHYLPDIFCFQSSVKMLSTAYSMCGIDTDILPFGQIKKEALLNALKILHQLR